MTAAFPRALAAHISAGVDGRTFALGTNASKGHESNPLNDAELETKFRSLARLVLPAVRIDSMLARLWKFEEEQSVTAWVESLRV